MLYSSQNIHGQKQIQIKLGDFVETIKIERVNEVRGFKISETEKNLFGEFFSNFGAELYLVQHINVVYILRNYSLYHAKFKTGQNLTISNEFGRYQLHFDHDPNIFLNVNFMINMVDGEPNLLNFFANKYLKNIFNETKQPEILEFINRINKKFFLEV